MNRNMEEFKIAVEEFKEAFNKAQQRHQKKLAYLHQRKRNLVRTKNITTGMINREIRRVTEQIKNTEEDIEANKTLRREMSSESINEYAGMNASDIGARNH